MLYKFNNWIELLGADKFLIRHSSKAKNTIVLKKIENRKNILIEKTIYSVEKEYHFNMGIEKKPQKLSSIEKKNYRIFRRVYQSLFVDVADIIYPIHQYHRFRLEQLENDLKANG